MRRLAYILLLLSALYACHKNDENVWIEKPVFKKVELHVHAGQHPSTYENKVTAGVIIQIVKVDVVNKQARLLWDTTITTRTLAQYPNLPQKLVIEKSFDILESREMLQAGYTITCHTSKGITRKTATGESAPGKHFTFVDVVI